MKEKTMSSKRLSVNITPLERIPRIVVGLVAVLAAALLLRDADSGVTIALEILLALAGLDLVVTGATGPLPAVQEAGPRPGLPERTPVMNAPDSGCRPSGQHEAPTPSLRPQNDHEAADHQRHGRGHALMMLACCVPMLLIAFALVACGTAGGGAILFALLCTAMMAAMMFAMPGHKQ
jgi:hypothetical protein